MISGVSIRVAAVDDQEALLALHRKYPREVTWREAVWGGFLGGVHASSRRVWLAETADLLAGFVVLNVAAGVGEFEMVLVDEAARGRGIARELCETAMQWAGAQGAKQIELEVRESNSAARALYLSLGFAEQGTRSNYYRHPTEDAVLMGVTL